MTLQKTIVESYAEMNRIRLEPAHYETIKQVIAGKADSHSHACRRSKLVAKGYLVAERHHGNRRKPVPEFSSDMSDLHRLWIDKYDDIKAIWISPQGAKIAKYVCAHPVADNNIADIAECVFQSEEGVLYQLRRLAKFGYIKAVNKPGTQKLYFKSALE